MRPEDIITQDDNENINKEEETNSEKKNEETELVSCRYFTTALLEMDKPYEKDLSALDSFLIVICTAGHGEIEDGEGHREGIRQGETVLIPASATSLKFFPEGNLKVLTSFV